MTKRFGGDLKEFIRINPLAMPDVLPHVITFTQPLLSDLEVVVFNVRTHRLVSHAWMNEESEQMYARARADVLKEQAAIKSLQPIPRSAEIEAQTKFITAIGQLAASVSSLYDNGPRSN